jgi:hypothetical protein
MRHSNLAEQLLMPQSTCKLAAAACLQRTAAQQVLAFNGGDLQQ